MDKDRREILNTMIALLALGLSSTTLIMQFRERAEKRAEILNYEIGGERVNAKQLDEFIKIYNYSVGDVYLESVTLRADMGEGLSRQAEVYRPRKPEPIHPGEFKDFRFRMNYLTAADKAAENKDEYRTFTGRSTVEVKTTKGTKLTFESHYHPHFIDRVSSALAKSGAIDSGILKVQ